NADCPSLPELRQRSSRTWHNGFMPRLLRFVPLVVALIVLSCGGGDNKTSSSSSSASGPSVSEVLTKSASAAKAAKSFHFSLKHSGDGSLPMPLNLRLVSADGDYVSPDRIKASVKTKAASANISVDVIGVGDKTWITNPFTRKWTSLPGTSVSDIADPTVIVGTLLNGLKDPKIVGTEDVDGVKTYHLTGTMDSGALVVAFGDGAKPG